MLFGVAPKSDPQDYKKPLKYQEKWTQNQEFWVEDIERSSPWFAESMKMKRMSKLNLDVQFSFHGLKES